MEKEMKGMHMSGDKPEMKSKIASKLLEKLGAIDPSSIEAITVQLVLKDAKPKMKEENEMKSEEDKEGENEEGDEYEDEE